MSELDNFLQECKRFIKYVNNNNNTDSSLISRRVDVGLHGRKASWSLDWSQDALGTEQPVLVGKYTITSSRKKKPEEKVDNNKTTTEHDSHDGSSTDEDELAAPPAVTSANHDDSRSNNKTSSSSSHQQLQITLFITYNQPYNIPSLDFIACDLESGQPVVDVAELKRDWLPRVADAIALDAQNARDFCYDFNDKDDEKEEDTNNTKNKTNIVTNTLLTASPVPQISRTIHEILNIPVFCVHACDTVSHFKLMKVQMMRNNRATSSSTTGETEEDMSQSPIDVVLSLYGKFIGLE